MPAYRGAKRAGDHSTLIEDAVDIVAFAQRLKEVTKISPGFIKGGTRRSQQSIKITEQTGCLLVKIHGRTSTQEVRIYTTDKPGVAEKIRYYFSFLSGEKKKI